MRILARTILLAAAALGLCAGIRLIWLRVSGPPSATLRVLIAGDSFGLTTTSDVFVNGVPAGEVVSVRERSTRDVAAEPGVAPVLAALRARHQRTVNELLARHLARLLAADREARLHSEDPGAALARWMEVSRATAEDVRRAMLPDPDRFVVAEIVLHEPAPAIPRGAVARIGASPLGLRAMIDVHTPPVAEGESRPAFIAALPEYTGRTIELLDEAANEFEGALAFGRSLRRTQEEPRPDGRRGIEGRTTDLAAGIAGAADWLKARNADLAKAATRLESVSRSLRESTVQVREARAPLDRAQENLTAWNGGLSRTWESLPRLEKAADDGADWMARTDARLAEMVDRLAKWERSLEDLGRIVTEKRAPFRRGEDELSRLRISAREAMFRLDRRAAYTGRLTERLAPGNLGHWLLGNEPREAEPFSPLRKE